MSSRAAVCVLASLAAACGVPAPIDASTTDAGTDAASDGGVELAALARGPRYAIVGEEIELDGSESTGASSYEWAFGDGRALAPSGDAIARTSYDAPGRYRAVLTVRDAIGRRRMASWLVTVTEPLVHAPASSSSVAVDPERREVAVVSPDSDELAVFSFAASPTLVRRYATADEPRTVTRWNDRWVVVCQAADRVQLFDPESDAAPVEIPMPRASRPFGAVARGDELLVSLQATGELARVDASLSVAREPAIEDARGVALLPDGRVAITRWRSPDDEAQIAVLGEGTREVWTLGFDPQPGSDTESGGVPSYLQQLLVSPTGTLALVPSLQAAIGEGLYVSPRPLTFETTVRAALSYLDPITGAEDFERRKLFDNRGLAIAGAFSSHGDYVYLALRGSRAIERLDVLTGAQAGSILDVGYAPQGLALSPDDGLLFVDAYLSRELVVYDVSDPSTLQIEVARLPIASAEPLSAEVLAGKRLFNDSFDPRLGRDSYMACAHCHLEGLSDRRVWDFTDRGEGLRNTIDLVGRAGEAPLHWSANFDEVQDFEHDIRGPFMGRGLMSDADFAVGTRDQPLGDPKAGVSADLDALAAYVRSLDAHLPSPYREDDGALPPAAVRGRALFESAGCPSCHSGPALTDSALVAPGVPLVHDVGTLGPGSGQRLGGPLLGIDTPTLHGLWHSAPYLHDGSAPTLRDVLTTRNAEDRHGVTSTLSAAEIDDLVAYLLCLDGRVE